MKEVTVKGGKRGRIRGWENNCKKDDDLYFLLK